MKGNFRLMNAPSIENIVEAIDLVGIVQARARAILDDHTATGKLRHPWHPTPWHPTHTWVP